jgi:hypothetical protein
MAVPYTFATASGSIPLSQLDADFAALPKSFQVDALTIGTTNVLPALSRTPAYQTGTTSGLFLLIVNGQVFVAAGASPPFSVTGSAITWLSATFSVTSYDTVIAVYSY